MASTTTSVEAFREEFRTTVPPRYSGIRHGGIILGTGVVAIAVCAALLQQPLYWFDWAMVPLVVLGWNWVEWYVHLKVLHRPGRNAVSRVLYNRHALTHHKFFTQADATLRDARDLKIVFFPAFALPAIIVLTGIPALVVGLLVSRNAGLMIVIATVAMYLLFEAFHLCAHLPERSWLTTLPIVNSMRRHHRAHHDQALMMTTNMNFTLPISDWCFKTCDLDRGLWGMTFNGNSEEHVRRKGSPQEPATGSS
jgi:hypothetical protein